VIRPVALEVGAGDFALRRVIAVTSALVTEHALRPPARALPRQRRRGRTLEVRGGRGARIAISLLAGTLNSAAAFSIAVASSGASTSPSQTPLLAIW